MDSKTKILTKEGFWVPLEREYPKAMAVFKAWIDEYKIAVDWDDLFISQNKFGVDSYKMIYPNDIKFHDLPDAMQVGIYLQYSLQSSHEFIRLMSHLWDFNDVGRIIQYHLQKCEDELKMHKRG
jgi:hypothetical protein